MSVNWQAADNTGLLYGIYSPNTTGQHVWVALDATSTTAPHAAITTTS
jgi:hypothetical protein